VTGETKGEAEWTGETRPPIHISGYATEKGRKKEQKDRNGKKKKLRKRRRKGKNIRVGRKVSSCR